jgi:hypothetical protein
MLYICVMRVQISRVANSVSRLFSDPKLVKFILPLALMAIEISIFWQQAKWNPNGIHDGIMYPGALSVAEGGVPNIDAFTQYGPYVMLLHGWWLDFTTSTLLSLRHLTAILLTAIGILLYLISKEIVSKNNASLISIIWVLSAPKLLPSTLPWSSVVSTLLTLFSVYLLLHRTNSSRKFFVYFNSTLSGLAVSLALMARIHLLLLPGLILIFLFSKRENNNTYEKLKFWINGFLIGIVIHVVYFSITNSFYEYWDQCISWAFNRFAVNTEPLSQQRVVAFLSSGIIIFVGLIGLIGIKIQTSKFRSMAKLNYSIFKLTYFIVFALLSILGISRHGIDPGKSSFLNPFFTLMWVAENFLQMGIYIVLILTLFYFSEILLRKKSAPISVNEAYLFMVGITALSQLYPSPDQLHLWWISPLLIILILYSLKRFKDGELYISSNRFRATSIVMILLLAAQLQMDSREQSYSFRNSALFGMTSSDVNAPAMDKTMLLLADVVDPHSMGVICEEGIYSASGMNYLASDAYFLETNGRFEIDKFKGKYIFACNLNQDSLDAFLATPGFRPRFEVELHNKLVNVLIERKSISQ